MWCWEFVHFFGGGTVTSVTPTTFLIDGSGRWLSKTVGIIDFSKLHAFLE